MSPEPSVLRHVRTHVERPRFLDKIGGIVVAVGTQRNCARSVAQGLDSAANRSA